MNHRLSALLFAVFLLTPASTVLLYAPEQGGEIQKKFTGQAHLVQTIETLNGSTSGDGRAEQLPFQVTGDLALELQFADVYRELAAGRPQTLGRELERAELTVTTELLVDIEDGAKPLSFEKKLRSERAKQPLLFRWQESAATFSAQLETGDDTPGLHLEKLREETDLRSFLPTEEPTGEIESGTTWNVPIHALSDVLSPGGDLAFRFEADGHAMHDDFKLFGTELGAILLDMKLGDESPLTAAVRATFRGHDEKNEHLAIIDVQFDLNEAGAATKTLQRMARDLSDRKRSLDAESKEFRLRGSGTIFWNTKTGLPEKADFEAQLNAEWLVTSRTKEVRGGGARVVTDRRTMTGNVERSFRASSGR